MLLDGIEFIKASEVAQTLGISRARLWQKEQRNRGFPESIKFVGRRMYRKDEIDAWVRGERPGMSVATPAADSETEQVDTPQLIEQELSPPVHQPLQWKPIVKRDRRSATGRRLIDHEHWLFALVGGERRASNAQRKAVSDAAEFALAAEKARAMFLNDEISASEFMRIQDLARDAARTVKETAR